MAARKNGEPSWRWRRTMAFAIAGFCCWIIASIEADTKVNEIKVTGAFWLLGTVFLLYGGFATAQDVSAILAARTGRPYADPERLPRPPDGWPPDIAPPPNDDGRVG